MSDDALRKLATSVRNWGRWGPDDEMFHTCATPNMGLTLGEIFFLEELAADRAADGRCDFLLVAPRCP